MVILGKIRFQCLKPLKYLRHFVMASGFILNALYSYGLSIFEVRRQLPMTKGEITQKDFYINGGEEEGLKPGMIVKVIRQLYLYDSYRNRSPGDLKVLVGELKILLVQKGVSVAREYQIFDRKNLPVLEENGFMIGDQLNMESTHFEQEKENTKAKTATVEVSSETEKSVETKVVADELDKNNFMTKAMNPSSIIKDTANPIETQLEDQQKKRVPPKKEQKPQKPLEL